MTICDFVIGLGSLAFGGFATAWLTRRYGLVRENFRRQQIPCVAGLFFLFSGDFFYAYEWLVQGVGVASAAVYFMVTLCFGVLGLADDLFGDRRTGGFQGHFRALLRGQFTTGAAKAIGGAIVALVAGFLLGYPVVPRMLLAALVIALSANAANLLDVRPGRALCGFLCAALALVGVLAAAHLLGIGLLLYFAIAAALLLYPLDSLGKAMLGDTGANTFGAVAGVAAVLYLQPGYQCAIAALLIVFQLWCERNSLSQSIEGNPVLRAIDRKIGVR